MPRTDAFCVDTATREVILSQSLCKSQPVNRDVRQTLGFHELRDGHGQPKFASKNVTLLHSALDDLKLTLPYHDLEKLRSEWQKGRLLQVDLDQLLNFPNEYGSRIWGIPVEERDSTNRPDMPLLRANHNKFYPTDLVWGIDSHRKYIKLQLEHLVYIKAIKYRTNHVAPLNVHQTAAAKVNTLESDTTCVYRPRSRANPSAIASGNATFMPGTKHHIDDDDEWTPYTSERSKRRKGVMHDSEDDISERRLARGSKARKSYTQFYPPEPSDPAESAGATDDMQTAQAAMNLIEGSTSGTLSLSRPTAEQWQPNAQTSDEESSLTDVPENLSDRAQSLEQDAPQTLSGLNRQVEADQSTEQVEPNRDKQGVTESSELIEDSVIGDLGYRANFNSTALSTSCNKNGRSQRNQTIDAARIELRELLRRDIGGIKTSDFDNIEDEMYDMWDNSEKLNSAVLELWEVEQEALREKMGPQLHECRHYVLSLWISWRDHARVIGTAINCHPARNEMPTYSYEMWAKKLGGEDAVNHVETQLFRCWECLQRFNKKTDEQDARNRVAEHLSAILSELTNQPKGRWINMVKRFNDKLFAWGPDLAYM
ncbi:hypothetical protein BDV96DRAFT_649695 [Lophiotrema nucula]|uniref:Uncharacterized protein n=1 Tax=Lophiotrema nucula TaxID=690887 RepID=A0A6A5YXB5_9PLEO|nr:hypothetical protein BDV96DRAFT_649695 [Lophiotrema nucula]